MHAVPLLPVLASMMLLQPAGAPPAPAGAMPPPPAGEAAAPAEFRTADELLTALETADRDLETLIADILYRREFGSIEGNEVQEWRGTLYYDADLTDQGDAAAAAPGEARQARRRGFAVVFDVSVLDNRERRERRDFVFDGQWLVERLHADRQMIRRRVVPPGEVADPLRIGEGPFPIPIGQRRDDILRRFEATLLPAEDGWASGQFPPVLRDSWQLRLVPKPGTDEAREFQEVRLWYQRITPPGGEAPRLLPRMARTQNFDGAAAEVLLTNLQPNQPIPPGVFDTSPPPPDAGWDVTTQEYRGGFDNEAERRR